MSKGHLKNHEEIHKEMKQYVCPVSGCGVSYSRSQRLEVHLKKHRGMRDHVCPFENCGKAFYEKGNLKTHLRLHTGEKPYFCTFESCTRAFATQGHLNDHMSKHHGPESIEALQDAFKNMQKVENALNMSMQTDSNLIQIRNAACSQNTSMYHGVHGMGDHQMIRMPLSNVLESAMLEQKQEQ